MKRLLIILPYVPYPLNRGSFQRVYHLAESLSHYFQVDLFCLSSEKEDAENQPRFDAFCERVHFEPFQNTPWPSFLTDRLWNPTPATVRHWWSEEVLQSLRGFTAGQNYDTIFFYDLVLWPYVKQVFPNHPARVMDRSRVDWLFQKEELNTLNVSLWNKLKRHENLWKIIRMEREVRRELAGMVVCGPDDRAFLEEHLGPDERIFVSANGANVGFFDATEWPPAPTSVPSALFCGALDYPPNTDGLGWYFENIHPLVMARRPDFKVILIGKNPTPEMIRLGDLDGVEFIGEVPDVRPYYQKAWMQIVPLRIGGGTRLKIAEGLAMKNPVVSTKLGAQGLELHHGKQLLLADKPLDFAEAILRYVDEPELRDSLANAGCQAIHDLYTWNALGRRLAARLEQFTPRKA